MKKFILFMLSVIMLTQSIGVIGMNATENIPDDLPSIEFDRQYWLEPGETAWYSFKAPAPLCYLTDMPLEEIDGCLCGWEVDSNSYYDKNGKFLGYISASNDPEAGGWTKFIPGDTYYLKVEAPSSKGVFFTLSAVKEAEPETSCEKESLVNKVKLISKAKKVDRFVPGEYNTLWDIYTVKEEFELTGSNVITSSSFFVTDYRVYFENSMLTADSGTVTYSSIERAAADSAELVKSYCSAPDKILSDSEYIYTANHYAYILEGNGNAVRSFDLLVPAGKTLIYTKDGYFRTAAAEELFGDVTADTWYTDAVLYNAEKSFMNGTGEGKFSPSVAFTRAQMVQMLANIDGADLEAYKNSESFTDVSSDKWYAPAVEWAYKNGVTGGIGEGKFAPERKVTREQIAKFLCSYAESKGALLPEGADLSAYPDSQSVSSWAKDYLSRAVALGLIKGTDGNKLSPLSNATRAQIAVISQRFDESVLKPLAPSTHKGSYFLEGDTCGFGTNYEIVELSGKEKPNVLYIGMASTNPAEGYGAVEAEYGAEFGCKTDYLTLEDLENGTAREKIMNADIISVGGGDSRMLLARLRKHGTDALLREAAAKGTVMSGSSAGAICFGVLGTSGIGDSRYENLNATGCVDLIVCPHGFEKARVNKVKEDLLKNPDRVAVVLGNSALEIKDGMYRIYADMEFMEHFDRGVIGMVYWSENGEIKTLDAFSHNIDWRPLSELGIYY